ncbi:nucleotide exchange factor GrpE [Calothrix sp. NIES-3974]|uniref:nucleotide exchange factor GrpE n=1 Tax=Calothrix sp. NIES-3974 TaxID=2005462 RepID=UPI000B5FF9EE|nr:GrpE protein [Calothrix sp. NIES-3974]
MNSDSPEPININSSQEQVTETVNSADDINNANQENQSPDNQMETGDAVVVAQLTQQIDSLKLQLEERQTQYMRIAADFENYRKRTQKEKEELDGQVKRNTITELLPVIDNFERARAQIKPQNDGEMNIHKSYQSVYKQLVDCLKRIGVSPMRPEGQPFDPNFHEAVMREPTDEYPEGTVLEELVRGYFLGDRVLRHAMVKVAAPKEDASPQAQDSVSTQGE